MSQAEPWDSLASQPSLLGEFHASESLSLKKEVDGSEE